MEKISEKEVEILNILVEEKNISQRKISNNLGLSLGLVNLFLKKLAHKGLIKFRKTTNKKSLKYILTPQGFKERLDYNLLYLKKNLKYYSNVKEIMLERLEKLFKNGTKNIYIYGIDNWSEIIYLAVKNFNFNILGFIDGEKPEIENKFAIKVYSIDEFNNLEQDNFVVLANLESKHNIENSGLFINGSLEITYF